MRPLRLEVSGLTCFREAVAVDFGDLELVAIEGATGAGKSSLLDAMILALYGIVPRIGSQGLGELISHGRSGLAVTFDFELRGTRWRVARTINRKRPSQALLSELVDEDGETVEKRRFNGVQEVQRELKALLGIDGAAFQQAVILPQGKFQEFLHSQPAERRRILSELLGLQVYATMRGRANERALELAAKVEALGRQLTGEGALASAEVVAELELQAGRATAERDALVARLESAREGKAELERVWARCQELVAIDEALVRIEAREPEIETITARVERAKAMMPLVPWVERARAAMRLVAALEARVGAADARRAAGVAALEKAEDAARTAELGAEQIATLRARITRLDEARGRFDQREALRVEATRAERAAASARAEAEATRAALAAAKEAAARAREGLVRLEAEAVPAVAPEELARWEALREVATRLGLARAGLARALAAAAEARAGLERGEDALAQAELERKKKESAEVLAGEAVERAEAALGAAEQAARVALVREHLHVGEACPVCEQVVETLPAGAVSAEVEGARAGVAEAKTRLSRARGEAERARERAVTAHAKVVEHEARVRDAEAQSEAAAAGIAGDEAALGAVVGEGEGPAEARFASGLEARQAGARRRSVHEAALAGEREALRRAEEEVARQGAALASVEARVSEAEGARSELGEKLAAVEEALAELSGVDPKRERAAAERLIGQLEGARAEALAEVARAREAASVAEVELAATKAQKGEAEAARAAALAALADGGATIDEVERDALSAGELAVAEERIAAQRAAREGKLAEREAVVRALEHKRTSAEEVAAAKRALAELADEARVVIERAAVSRERLDKAREELARAKDVGAEHEARRRELQVYKRLSDDLSPRNFQEFLLEEVVADLVRGASERLYGLSGGRYRMAADTSAGFLVVDLDHAGERRSTDTLSGGETFLASLAMALELSEQIRAKAGRVDLDCIFIDEGFGTLDPETLETVTEAVEGLKRPGRLVGIITHVSELAQRMPERLVVEKSAVGSTVRFADTMAIRGDVAAV